MESRRNFIRKSAIGLAAASLPGFSATAGIFTSADTNNAFLAPNDRILFQGDSITDAGRDRTMKRPNYGKGMGKGYALLAASHILNRYPQHGLSFYNRGVSGDTVTRIIARWEEDCFQINPDIVSFQVGVNDFNEAYSATGRGDAKKFANDYETLLRMTVERLPGVKLMIAEPFALRGITGLTDNWQDFHSYRAVAKSLAQKFSATFVPYQSDFDQIMKNSPHGYFSTDGVHPSLAGIYLMSRTWLSKVVVNQ